MSTPAPGASASTRKTRFTKFFSVTPEQDRLFAVNDGISVDDAMETASTFLATALGMLNRIVEELDDDGAWAALYLVEMSKAVVDASILAMIRERRSHD